MADAARLYLIDGSSYLYRAFHALPPFTNAKGEPTGAVLGVVNMLQKFLKAEQPTHIAVVFDAPGRTFRDDLFEAYKAHRPPMPDELRAQIAPLLATVEALGLPLLRVAGVEADDVIGTLARRGVAAGMRVVISTGDKDMAQLVDEQVTLVNTMYDTTLDRAGVKAKFDVEATQIVDYLALVGDSSDNIPGVPKVGPKNAAKLLAQYGSIDALVARAAEIEGRIGESLRENLAQLELSRRLATIRCDLELAVTPAGLERRPPDLARLRALYQELGFKRLLESLDGGAAAPAAPAAGSAGAAPAAAAPVAGADPAAAAIAAAPRHYETVLTEAALEKWLARLASAPLFAFDTETTGLDYMSAEIVGVSFCAEPGEAAYVPLAHDYPGAPEQLPRAAVLERLKPLLEDPARAKLGHHAKFDTHILANHGIRFAGVRFDSMLESYVLNSVATRHDMDSVAERYLGIRTIHFEDVAGKGAKQLSFNQVPLETAGPYSAEDADVTLRLHRVLRARLEAEPRLARLYDTLEQPLQPVLQRMERRGVLVDPAFLKALSVEFTRRLGELERAAHEAAGGPFNLESPKQLQQILFERLQIPVIRRTPTGQPSTAEDVLEELAANHALPRLILDFRGIAKLKSTYTDTLAAQVNPATGRIHTSYHQAVAATGRLSSSDPNLQNIPIRTPEGRRIRQAFVAPPGRVLMAADYSQIELRIMAHLSGDEGLLRAFAEGRDVHEATAAEMFGVAPGAVSADQRRAAKAINFGLMYGMSAFGLAARLDLDRGAAAQYIERYFERYPGVRRYMDETRRRAREQGYVETVEGRRLYLPEIRSRNRQQQQYAERAAINAPMQGTAADIIKRAMLAVDDWLEREAVGATLVMQVHDELVLEVDGGAVERVRARLTELMCAAAKLAVPLEVGIGVGANWDEAH
ncbi:MAG TPA: DNA polymerase I [Steroidobacteraceae bacterium]|nr:DNA polymerase I [Steroidobacteraceae bacterium]